MQAKNSRYLSSSENPTPFAFKVIILSMISHGNRLRGCRRPVEKIVYDQSFMTRPCKPIKNGAYSRYLSRGTHDVAGSVCRGRGSPPRAGAAIRPEGNDRHGDLRGVVRCGRMGRCRGLVRRGGRLAEDIPCPEKGHAIA